MIIFFFLVLVFSPLGPLGAATSTNEWIPENYEHKVSRKKAKKPNADFRVPRPKAESWTLTYVAPEYSVEPLSARVVEMKECIWPEPHNEAAGMSLVLQFLARFFFSLPVLFLGMIYIFWNIENSKNSLGLSKPSRLWIAKSPLDCQEVDILFVTMSSFCDNKRQYSAFFGAQEVLHENQTAFKHIDWPAVPGGEFFPATLCMDSSKVW